MAPGGDDSQQKRRWIMGMDPDTAEERLATLRRQRASATPSPANRTSGQGVKKPKSKLRKGLKNTGAVSRRSVVPDENDPNQRDETPQDDPRTDSAEVEERTHSKKQNNMFKIKVEMEDKMPLDEPQTSIAEVEKHADTVGQQEMPLQEPQTSVAEVEKHADAAKQSDIVETEMQMGDEMPLDEPQTSVAEVEKHADTVGQQEMPLQEPQTSVAEVEEHADAAKQNNLAETEMQVEDEMDIEVSTTVRADFEDPNTSDRTFHAIDATDGNNVEQNTTAENQIPPGEDQPIFNHTQISVNHPKDEAPPSMLPVRQDPQNEETVCSSIVPNEQRVIDRAAEVVNEELLDDEKLIAEEREQNIYLKKKAMSMEMMRLCCREVVNGAGNDMNTGFELNPDQMDSVNRVRVLDSEVANTFRTANRKGKAASAISLTLNAAIGAVHCALREFESIREDFERVARSSEHE